MDATLSSYVRSSKLATACIPLPEGLVTGGALDLTGCDDDDLLIVPAHLITHLKRTEANGGVQVLSGRVVPLARSVSRYLGEHRTNDLIVAGSVASTDFVWPTVDGRDMSLLVSGQPAVSWTTPPGIPSRLRTEGVYKYIGKEGATNPIYKALSTAVGITDLQKRIDIGGDPRRVAGVIEAAWGMKAGTLMALTMYSVAPQEDLLRYAVRTDEGLAMVCDAPNILGVVSTTSGLQERAIYGAHRSVNYAAMRVAATATLIMSIALEGHSLLTVSSATAPGDPTAPAQVPGQLAFRPAPGVVFTYYPSSFKLAPAKVDPRASSLVHAALPPQFAEFVERAVAKAQVTLSMPGSSGKMTLTGPVELVAPPSGTIAVATERVVTRARWSSPRGKNYMSLLKAAMYQHFTGSTATAASTALMICKYAKETREWLGSACSDWSVVQSLAPMLSPCVDGLSLHISSEATRLGHTIESWFTCALEMMPDMYRTLTCDTNGWAFVLGYIVVVDPDSSWDKTTNAASISVLRTMASAQHRDIRLMRDTGVRAAIAICAEATVKATRELWAGWYRAMSTVAEVFVAAAALDTRWLSYEQRRKQDGLKVAALLWKFRSDAAKSVSVSVRPTDLNEELRPTARYYHREGLTVKVYMKPYKPYKDLRVGIGLLKLEGSIVDLPDIAEDQVTDGVVSMRLAEATSSFRVRGAEWTRLMRYVYNPPLLGEHMEAALDYTMRDLMGVYEEARREILLSAKAEIAPAPVDVDVLAEAPLSPLMAGKTEFVVPVFSGLSGWTWLGRVNGEMADIAADGLVGLIGETAAHAFLNAMHPSQEDFEASLAELTVAQQDARRVATRANALR